MLRKLRLRPVQRKKKRPRPRRCAHVSDQSSVTILFNDRVSQFCQNGEQFLAIFSEIITAGKPTADQWDKCTSAGTFKSKSFCYQNPTTMNYVYRYDFYKCVRSPAGPWLLYRQNCTGPVVVVDGEVFNRYNSATGRCDLQPPSS